MTSDQKGAIAESAVLHAAVKLGIGVSKPLSDGERYDLVFDLRPRLIRVQCKWANRREGVVAVPCYSCRRTASGMLSRPYTAREVDAVAAYCPDTGCCYLLPGGLVEGHWEISLRLEPTRNRQKLGVRWADDFEFTRLDWKTISGP